MTTELISPSGERVTSIASAGDLEELYAARPGETPEERARRLARERKRKQRAAEQAALQAAQAKTFELNLYQNTQECLDKIAKVCGFEGPEVAQEVFTLLLHGAAALVDRDRHEILQDLVNPSRWGKL